MTSSRHMPANADLVFFRVRCHLAPLVADVSSDSDYDPNIAAITATVVFTPRLKAGEVIHAHEALPPTGFLPLPVVAMIDSDGLLKLRSNPDSGAAPLPAGLDRLRHRLVADGNKQIAVNTPEDRSTTNYAPVKLLGNCPALELEDPLYYDFAFSNIKIDGQPSNYTITGGTFEAPSDPDEVIDLLDWMPLPSGPYATGIIRGPEGPPGPPGLDGSFDFNSLAFKNPPVDADQFVIGDSAARAAYDAKKITWANLKAALKSFFDPTYEAKANKGLANGYASLDASTRLPSAQLPLSAAEWKGAYDAATNTPALGNGIGTAGDMYRVSVAGVQFGGIGLYVNDVIYYDGAVWRRLGPNTDYFEKVANKSQPGGYAALGSDTRVPSSQLTLSAVEYKGQWNAALNSPTLANGTGNMGDIYRVIAAGTQLGLTVAVGDVVFYDGTTWHKLGAGDATTYQAKAEKGQASGYASLDATTRLPANQLTLSAVEFKGTYNAATNSPALANGTGQVGDMYRVSVAGVQLGLTLAVNDVVLYDGSVWHRLGGGGGAVDTSLFEKVANKSQPNGYAALDASTRLPSAQLPLSAAEWKGTYDAATNTPPLGPGVGQVGDMYRVSVAGVQFGGIGLYVNDVIYYDGANWRRIGPNTDYFEKYENKSVAGGYAALGSDTRLPSSQLTQSAVEYKGQWNAALNSPTLANGTGNMGDIYRVIAAGTQLGITAAAGDVVFYDGAVWHKLGAADGSLYQLKSEKGQANGFASLDAGGKVPVAQLPSSLMAYLGVWNASTNSPALANGTGSPGDVYRVGTAGTQFGITFDVGDYAIYNGTTWEKSDTTDAVASVAGKTGIVTLTKADVGLPLVDNTADASKAVLSATKLVPGRKINGTLFDGTADITVTAAPSVAALPEKTVPVDADFVVIGDSEAAAKAAGDPKRLSFANLKLALGVWYDTAVRTLTNKTLTSPKVNELLDVNGAKALAVEAVAGAVNYITLRNSAAGSTGATTARLRMDGPDANVSFRVQSKGAGGFIALDGSNTTLISAVPQVDPTTVFPALTMGTAASPTVTFGLGGTETNANLNLQARGTGVVQAGGIPVVTTNAVQTLSNKTLTAPKVGKFIDSNGDAVLVFNAVGPLLRDDGVEPTSAETADVTPKLGEGPRFIGIKNATATNPPTIGSGSSAAGDADVPLLLDPQGTAPLYISNGKVSAWHPTGAGRDLNLAGYNGGIVKANDNPVVTRLAAVPATATSTGVIGQTAADTNWLYVCVAANTWRRVALTTW